MSKVQKNTDKSIFIQAAITYGIIALWIFLSATVILINKYILSAGDFPLPITLTLIHMAFCSVVAFILVRCKVCEPVYMDASTYLKTILPIGALFSGTLWFGNAAYIYLSVSFIQMLKASMPITVLVVGIWVGTEKYSAKYTLNMILVAIGVCIASYGEINFVLTGVFFQVASICFESLRLVLIQVLLQSRGIKLNPITTLYYVSPACFVCLCFPFAIIELPQLINPSSTLQFPVSWVAMSALSAFALNMSVFLLIGRSSALTMNIAGVVKDWMLIGLSFLIFKSSITSLQVGGYLIAFSGVCWYNYNKLQQARQNALEAAATSTASLSSPDASKDFESRVPLIALSEKSGDDSILRSRDLEKGFK